MIGAMVEDLTAETQHRLKEAKPKSVDELRHLGRPVVAFSATMTANDRALKDFLYRRMYRHYKVNRMASRARRVVRELFDLFIAEPDCLPTDWRERCDGIRTPRSARAVADYIAGMTDRYAFKEHHRLFGPPES
jgi:dGTPase